MSSFNLCITRSLSLLLFLTFLPILNAQESQEINDNLEKARLNIYHNPKKAVDLSLSVYEKTTNDDTKITALITLVNGYTALNQNEKALRYTMKAIALARETDNLNNQVRTIGLLGEQYQLYHLNDISRKYLKEAKSLLDQANLAKGKKALSKGNIFAVMGNGYKDEIDCIYAIENYDMAIQSYQEAVTENSGAKNNLALVYLEKGNCLLELDAFAAAEINFKSGLSIAEENQLKEYTQYAKLGLAKIASKNKNYDNAIQNLTSLLHEIDTSFQPIIKNDIYFLLKQNYLAKGALENYNYFKNKYNYSSAEKDQLEKTQFDQVLNFLNRQ
ncbi:MAG: hypothetical protein L0J60_01885, partial [Psychroflexus sp.]|nr:hypothetical protein [Psychroflexus sp.]